ncbi:MAG: nicotinate-nucleotide--dimethylbenzimidazole phosphoribosyltransferase [Candidatus Faecivicinus sp.]
MDQLILETIQKISAPDSAAMESARARQLSLAKPPRSLGKLEEISIRVAGMTGRLYNRADKRRVLVFASDNGIVEEGVASAPQSVTLAQTINIARGLTGVGVIARHYHAETDVIDLGVNADFSHPGVRNEKIAYGTKNFACEPAMSREQAERALCIGIEAAQRASRDGMEIIGIGEMGIGNTSTSSAVLSTLLGLPAEETVSRGGGVNDEGFLRKKSVIDHAIAAHRPDPEDPIDVLAKVGGFDLCGMTGAFLGAAAAHLPVVIDGFISAVAALCASRLCPTSVHYMLPSHASMERGYSLAMRALKLNPILQLDMRLGEGSGCPIAFEIVSTALDVLANMATFEEAAIDDGYLSEIRSNEKFQG